MIEFVTLFLGLVIGTTTVEVSVDESVATVEMFLDQRSLGTVSGEPWTLRCDLGDALAPHELVAVAKDADGEEVGRVSQWLNVPRPRAEARLSLDGDPQTGSATAGLVWQALDFDAPESVAVFLDGTPLEVNDPRRFALPRFDPEKVHLLRAELHFSDAVQTSTEVVFGGRYGHRVNTRLTALAVTSKRRGLPRPEAMEGWFTKDGEPLRVAAVERPPMDLFVVRELSDKNLEGLKSLAGARRTRLGATVPVPVGLGPEDRLRLVFPTAVIRRRASGQVLHMMESSGNISSVGDGALLTALTAAFFKSVEVPTENQRLADAVAYAGLLATGANRSRAVLLIHAGEARDVSVFSVAQVRDYLRRIHVPLVVWTPVSRVAKAPSPWGRSEEISNLQKVGQAIGRLRQQVDRQVVVWLEGGHLPHRIELSPRAKGLEPAG